MKALKSKETELSKIVIQKEKLSYEVESMRSIVLEQKRKRVDMQKKMHEDAALFQSEKTKLKQSEVQSRRREMLAQKSLSTLGDQLLTKERVWKSRLEVMERKSKLLQDQLMLKKERAQDGHMHRIDKTAALSGEKMRAMKKGIDREVAQQTKVALLRSQLSQAIAQRMKATKRNAVKQQTARVEGTNIDHQRKGDKVTFCPVNRHRELLRRR